MTKRIARPALLCAVSASLSTAVLAVVSAALLMLAPYPAAAQTPFEWSDAVVVKVLSDAGDAHVAELDELPGAALLVDPADLPAADLGPLVKQARANGRHVVVALGSGDPANAARWAAYGVDGFLVDGALLGPVADAMRSLEGSRTPRIAGRAPGADASASGLHAVVVEASDLPSSWEAAFAGLAEASPPRVVRLPVGDLRDERLRGLLLAPGGVILDEVPDDQIARAVVAFRVRHPAVGAGRHDQLVNSAYAFHRSLDRDGRRDAVVVVLGASGPTTVNVSRAFPDDTLLQDALTGRTAFVSFGMARFDAHDSGLILVEEVR